MDNSKYEKIFSKNLKYYMDLTDTTRYRLCLDLDLPYTTLAGWYSGKIYPRMDKLHLLAEYFNIKVSDLIEDKNESDDSQHSTVSIPLIGSLKSEANYLSKNNWIDTITVEKSLVSDNTSFFALKVQDDSMSPFLLLNDTIIVKKQNYFKNGDIVVSFLDGNKTLIRKAIKNNSNILLYSPNSNYEPQLFPYNKVNNSPISIIGVVKQLKRDF